MCILFDSGQPCYHKSIGFFPHRRFILFNLLTKTSTAIPTHVEFLYIHTPSGWMKVLNENAIWLLWNTIWVRQHPTYPHRLRLTICWSNCNKEPFSNILPYPKRWLWSTTQRTNVRIILPKLLTILAILYYLICKICFHTHCWPKSFPQNITGSDWFM